MARYTSAAPFFFKELENYIDGGMLANNPAEAAMTVIQDYYHNKGEKIPISMLVSVGSGTNPGTPLGEIDIKSNLLKPRAYRDLTEVFGAAVSCCFMCQKKQHMTYVHVMPPIAVYLFKKIFFLFMSCHSLFSSSIFKFDKTISNFILLDNCIST